MTKNIKISAWLLICSILTFFIGKLEFLGPIKISDYLIFLSLIFFVIALIKKEIKITLNKKIFSSMFFCFLSILIGTLSSLIIFKHIPFFEVIKGYLHLIVIFIYILEINIISRYDSSLIKKIFYSFLVSLSIIPLIYFPQISKHLLYAGNRFQGLLNDPNYFANFQIIPTIILLWLIQKDNTKNIVRVLLSVLFFFSIGLILWSGSRSGLLGISASLVSFILLMFINKNPIKKILLLSLLIIISFPVGYNLMPKNSHKNIEVRLGHITENADNNLIINVNNNDSYDQKEVIKKISGNQDRINIWIDSIHFIKKNPLGYGPGYNQIVNIRGDNSNNRVAHNFFLEILLTGGIFLFIFIIYLLTKIIWGLTKECYLNKEMNKNLIIFSVLLGILFSSMFLDMLLHKWLWILIAIYYSTNLKLNPSVNLKKKAKNIFL